MWPRVAELLIGLWLAASPWVFIDNPAMTAWHINGVICGLAIASLSMLSLWPMSKAAHLAEIPIGIWILGFTYFGSTFSASAIVQSNLLAALFLLNFAIIPSHANLPPHSWREFRGDNRPPARAVRGSSALSS